MDPVSLPNLGGAGNFPDIGFDLGMMPERGQGGRRGEEGESSNCVSLVIHDDANCSFGCADGLTCGGINPTLESWPLSNP